MSKDQMRKDALTRRDAMSDEARIEASLTLANFAHQIEFDPGTIISGFFPIRSEIDLRPLMASLAERQARLAAPVVLDRETIVFREIIRGAPLVETGFGTSGPGPEATVVDPAILLVPLAAFDRMGNRIGYGAGHYDRAISRLLRKGLRPHLIGTAFDSQEVDRVPAEPHDIPLDAMLTESGLRMINSEES